MNDARALTQQVAASNTQQNAPIRHAKAARRTVDVTEAIKKWP
jgi:hypothetical protein